MILLLFLSNDAISLHVCTASLACMKVFKTSPRNLPSASLSNLNVCLLVFAADGKSGGRSLAFLFMRAECVDDIGLTFAYPATPSLSLVSPPFVPQWYYTVLVAQRDYQPISRLRSPFII